MLWYDKSKMVRHTFMKPDKFTVIYILTIITRFGEIVKDVELSVILVKRATILTHWHSENKNRHIFK